MNRRLTALLMASLAGLMLAGEVLAAPRFLDGEWLAARQEREYGKREEREARKQRRQEDRRSEERAEDKERERGYGYGYERRSLRPQHDDRGRR